MYTGGIAMSPSREILGNSPANSQSSVTDCGVAMTNSVNVTALQCDLVLPEGFTPVMADGTYQIDLVEERVKSSQLLKLPVAQFRKVFLNQFHTNKQAILSWCKNKYFFLFRQTKWQYLLRQMAAFKKTVTLFKILVTTF